MTRTVKLENGGAASIADLGDGACLFVEHGPHGPVLSITLTPRDVGRLIAALARTKAALADRQRRRTVAA